MVIERRTIGLAAVGLLCAACTVGPEPKTPAVDVPASWTDAGDVPSRAVARPDDGRPWWKVFNDPVLDRRIATAATQSLDLQQTALRIAEARAQRDSVAGGAYPDVEASGIGGRARLSENGPTSALAGGGGSGSGSSPSTFDLFQAGFDASWELDLFGKVRRNVQASEADIRSAEAARHDALVSLAAEIARAYLGLRGSERQRAIVLGDLAVRENLQRLIESRNRAGFVPSSDVVNQRVQVEASRAQLPQLEQSIAQSKNRLALLLALPPGGVEDIVGPGAGGRTGLDLPPEVPVGLPGDLLRRRPDIRQKEAEIEAATARIGVARASLFPSVRLGLTGGLQATRAADLSDWASRFAIGGVQLSVPIFEGGRLQAEVRIRDLQEQEAVLSYRQTVLAAFHDVDDALIAYAGEQRHAEALGRQLDGARRGRALTEERYRNGLAGYTDVLEAQQQADQAELVLAGSLVTAATDLVALFKALGGGWEDASIAAR